MDETKEDVQQDAPQDAPQETRRVCACCGLGLADGDGTEVRGGGEVCDGCLRADFVECYDCGDFVPRDEVTLVEGVGEVCNDCLNDHYEQCDECGELFHIDDLQRVGRDMLCNSCAEDYVECCECGCRVGYAEAIEHGGHYRCEDCHNEMFVECDHCGETVRRDDADFVNGCCYCDECAQDEMRGEVMNYHAFRKMHGYKPLSVEGESLPEHPLYMGVELECDDGRFDGGGFSEWTEDLRIHFEHDGSLSGCGVECITQPCTLLYHQNELGWEGILAELREQGFRSHNTDCCGLHVHLSRAALSPLAIIKLDVFINRGRDFFSQIARRSEIYSGRWDVNKNASADKGKYISCNRYEAVNTANSGTVEIRIFKGTLKLQTLLGTIEMLDALVRFLELVPIAKIYDTDGNVLKFVDYCGENRGKYPHVIPMFKSLVSGMECTSNIGYWYKKQQKENEKCA